MAQGGSKIREAYLIFQDFAEKYPMTGMVLNGKAVCCMHMGSFEEAETLLLEALNKVSTDDQANFSSSGEPGKHVTFLFELLNPYFYSCRMQKILKLLPTLSYAISTLANHHHDISGMKFTPEQLQYLYCSVSHSLIM
jgi:hypothetical protein